MENEIGEYGRTNLGKIIKFAWLEDEKGKKYKNKVILVDLMLKETYPYYYFKKGEYIVKHSPNLKDLIQKDDFVNGDRVVAIDYTEDENGNYVDVLGIMEIDDDYAYPIELRVINIQEVVTKEMMESISYKVTKM